MIRRRSQQQVQSAGAGYLTSVFRGGSKFIAVGQGGAVLTSSSGASWARTTVPGEAWLTDVAWSGLQYVAASFDGTVLTSQSGAGWTPRAETGAQLRRLVALQGHGLGRDKDFVLGDLVHGVSSSRL